MPGALSVLKINVSLHYFSFNMQKYIEILKKYWGYDQFRSLQGDIIQSIAEGKDTLGLMPTGGGKSLTFQVPALAMEGVCIVVTPLIALMKDQVESLKRKNIRAAAIYSGMTREEIVVTLENCVFEAYKFLYVSPERLATRIFLEKVSQMRVCIIAVDESHCISQWGYDFRPSYLRIADLRMTLPQTPVLALTATATLEVVDDIQERLAFKKKNVLRKSFMRQNLAYVVRSTENKEDQLLRILSSVPGTSIVYVRNRKRTKEIADFLVQNGVSAEHFHAGLSNQVKDARQQRWKNNQTRVIVSTNAFGMGIDKPEVRTVVHMDLPDSLEAYFQEAGRAGRDEKKAWAVVLFNNTDVTKMRKRLTDTFPEKEMIRKVYNALGNYYQVAVGSGLDKTFAFDLADFCANFKLPILISHNAIKLLEQAGYLHLTDEQDNSSRILFVVDKDDLYKLRLTESQDRLIHLLLRSYTGLFSETAYISEEILAKRLDWMKEKVVEQLIGLSKERVIQYIPRKKTPFLTFTHEREDADRLLLGKEAYDDRKDRYVMRVKKVVDYVREDSICRNQLLLAYFGEFYSSPCGQCDLCLKTKELEVTNADYSSISSTITDLLKASPLTLKQLMQKTGQKEQKVLSVIRFMMDHHQVVQTAGMKFGLPD